MNQDELEKGADAVKHVADLHGVGNFINRDQQREIAAAVIRATK